MNLTQEKQYREQPNGYQKTCGTGGWTGERVKSINCAVMDGN